MKTVQQIRDQAGLLWESGRLLRALLGQEPDLFPYSISLGAPSSKELRESFAQVRAWKESIDSGCACHVGKGYRVEYEELNHSQLGEQRFPSRVVFDSPADLLGYLGKERELARFAALNRDIRAQQPLLAEWVAENPLRVLDLAGHWPRLLAVMEFFQVLLGENGYLRDLAVPNVDSKFISGQRELLFELLSFVLPPEVVDSALAILARTGVEPR